MSQAEKGEWINTKLCDLVSIRTGKLNSNASKADGAYPFFTCSREVFKTDTFSFDCECVLLAGNNAAGIYPIHFFRGKFDAYQRTYVMASKAINRLDNRFLFYTLQPKLEMLKSISTGSATKFLTLTILNDLNLYLPSIETQRRIASILGAYDDLIENNQRRIRILEEMAQRLYREWFVYFRYPGHHNTPLIDSPLGPIPKGWEVRAFTDVVDVLSGGTPSKSREDYWGGDIPFFTPSDAPKNFFVLDTEQHITKAGLDKCASQLYPKNTVFVTARGTVGKVALASRDMAMNQSCYALRGSKGYHQYFVYLLTLESVDYLKRNTGGATFSTIIVDTFRRFNIVVPPVSLVSKFVTVVFSMIETSSVLTQKSATLKTTRDLLLPKLVSGDVNPQA